MESERSSSQSGIAIAERPAKVGYTPAETRRALWYIMVAWIFGAAFASITSSGAIASFFTKYLKADDFSYGLIMAAGPAAVLFQFLGTYVIERTGRVKRNFLIFATLHRLLWLGVSVIAMISHLISTQMAVVLVGVICFTSAATANFGGTGWPTWMSDIIPRSVAGKFFGNRARLGMLSMVIAAIGVALLLDRFAREGWMYALVFGLAALFGATDILLFTTIREIPRKVQGQLPTLVDILTTPWKNAIFRNYAFYTVAAWIAYNMMGPFVWRFCLDGRAEHGMGLSLFTTQVILFVLPLLAQAVMSPLWGEAIDKFGPRPVLAASSISALIAPLGWLVMHHELLWLLAIQAVIGGLLWPGIEQTFVYMQIKGFPDDRRTTYNAMFAVIFGLSGTLGTALGGALASWFAHLMPQMPHLPAWVSHYHPLFAVSMVVRLLAFLLLFPTLRLAGKGTVAQVYQNVLREALYLIPGVRLLRRRALQRRVKVVNAIPRSEGK